MLGLTKKHFFLTLKVVEMENTFLLMTVNLEIKIIHFLYVNRNNNDWIRFVINFKFLKFINRSEGLIKICRDRNLQCFVADGLLLPYRSDIFVKSTKFYLFLSKRIQQFQLQLYIISAQ